MRFHQLMRSNQPHKIRQKTLLVLLIVGLSINACSRNSGDLNTNGADPNPPATTRAMGNQGFGDRQILVDFADQVIIPTFQKFADHAGALETALSSFAKTPTEQSLKAAQDAWFTARFAWEQTESFGFGPADSLGYDGALDTWPINETDIKKVLSSQEPLTEAAIAKLPESQKGFHVIELLLFGSGKSKQASQFTAREREYLQALGQDFSNTATALITSWKQGMEGKLPYREVLATAGADSNSTYPTLQAGAEEIVNGMVESLDEVANEKIGKAFEQQDVQLLESRFSLHTLNDLKSNLQGVKNVYLGSFPTANTSGASLSGYIASVKPELDQKIKRQFETAETALAKIPAPLERSLTNPTTAAAIRGAQAAINTLHLTMKQEVLPLVTG